MFHYFSCTPIFCSTCVPGLKNRFTITLVDKVWRGNLIFQHDFYNISPLYFCIKPVMAIVFNLRFRIYVYCIWLSWFAAKWGLSNWGEIWWSGGNVTADKEVVNLSLTQYSNQLLLPIERVCGSGYNQGGLRISELLFQNSFLTMHTQSLLKVIFWLIFALLLVGSSLVLIWKNTNPLPLFTMTIPNELKGTILGCKEKTSWRHIYCDVFSEWA